MKESMWFLVNPKLLYVILKSPFYSSLQRAHLSEEKDFAKILSSIVFKHPGCVPTSYTNEIPGISIFVTDY